MSPFLCSSVLSATADRREGKGRAVAGALKGGATQARLARSFLAAGLFCNCSQIMLAPEAILGTALVLNHIFYLILILFLLLSWIQEPNQQTPCAGRCPRCGKCLGEWDRLGKSSCLEQPPRDEGPSPCVSPLVSQSACGEPHGTSEMPGARHRASPWLGPVRRNRGNSSPAPEAPEGGPGAGSPPASRGLGMVLLCSLLPFVRQVSGEAGGPCFPEPRPRSHQEPGGVSGPGFSGGSGFGGASPAGR